jgi:hypothetical protein
MFLQGGGEYTYNLLRGIDSDRYGVTPSSLPVKFVVTEIGWPCTPFKTAVIDDLFTAAGPLHITVKDYLYKSAETEFPMFEIFEQVYTDCLEITKSCNTIGNECVSISFKN